MTTNPSRRIRVKRVADTETAKQEEFKVGHIVAIVESSGFFRIKKKKLDDDGRVRFTLVRAQGMDAKGKPINVYGDDSLVRVSLQDVQAEIDRVHRVLHGLEALEAELYDAEYWDCDETAHRAITRSDERVPYVDDFTDPYTVI